MKSKRERYLDSKRRDLTQYAGMVGEEFQSKVVQLSKILGNVHELSVGEHKESILRACIQNFLPKRYSVGTGFIIFADESSLRQSAGDNADLLNLKSYHVSQQLDIIVFDDIDYAPVFRTEDFVVVRPESVRAVIEVKGYLRRADIKSCVGKFASFGRAWLAYKYHYRNRSINIPTLEIPALLLMAWSVYVDPTGKQNCDGGLLRRNC